MPAPVRHQTLDIHAPPRGCLPVRARNRGGAVASPGRVGVGGARPGWVQCLSRGGGGGAGGCLGLRPLARRRRMNAVGRMSDPG